MDDLGKRLLLAVVVAFGIMMAWNALFSPKQQPEEKSPATAESTDTAGTGTAKRDGLQPDLREPSLASADKQVQGPAAPVEVARGEEQLITLEFPNFKATFSSYGGTLHSWLLLGDKFKLDDQQMDMVRPSGSEDVPFFGTRFVEMKWPEKTEWKGRKVNDTTVEFTWSYMIPGPEGTPVPAFDFIKTYQLYPDDYLVKITVDVVNKGASEDKQALGISLHGYQDPSEKVGGGLTSIDRSWKAACYVDEELETASAKSLRSSTRQHTGSIGWAGFLHSFFLVAASPRLETSIPLSCNFSTVAEQPGVMLTEIVFPLASMRVGGPASSYELYAYLGPNYLDKLETVSQVIGYDPGMSVAVDLGWFGFLARPLLWLLQEFHDVVGNWGVAIILLTILVKLLTLYWTHKSMQSMKQMAKLKPQVEALQKKYKDDKQRQQVEMMNLYKAHKVNPISGCLPMLLQMPVWFALYKMLMTAAELYHAPFIPGWIDDLTATDPYHILPVSLMGMMFLQAKLSPTSPDSTQQKIMMYGMPLMFGVFSFFFPAGLTLYIFTNTTLTAAHHLWMSRNEQAKGGKLTEAAGKSMAKDRSTSSMASEKVSHELEAEPADDDEETDADGDSGQPASSKKPRNRAGRRRSSKRKRGSGGKS